MRAWGGQSCRGQQTNLSPIAKSNVLVRSFEVLKFDILTFDSLSITHFYHDLEFSHDFMNACVIMCPSFDTQHCGTARTKVALPSQAADFTGQGGETRRFSADTAWFQGKGPKDPKLLAKPEANVRLDFGNKPSLCVAQPL